MDVGANARNLDLGLIQNCLAGTHGLSQVCTGEYARREHFGIYKYGL